jgi:uncharacterized delta-60 repeat protein
MKRILRFLSVTLILQISYTLAIAASGELDLTFNNSGKVQTNMGVANDVTTAIATQIDGKIVCVGYSSNNNGNYDVAVLRFNVDGLLDTSFDGDGKILKAIGSGDDWAAALAIQTDGKILVGGTSFTGENDDFAILRFNADGSLDNTFGVGGIVTTKILKEDRIAGIALQFDGKIIAVGTSYQPPGDVIGTTVVARYNPNGTLDASFGASGISLIGITEGSFSPTSVKIQLDGKIVVGGSSTNGNVTGFAIFAMARFNRIGTLDTTFNTNGKVYTQIGAAFSRVSSLAIQNDGKIILGGASSNFHFTSDFTIARYQPNGLLDPSFNSDGIVITDLSPQFDGGFSLQIQPDGKIVFAGSFFENPTTFSNFAVVRYLPNGNVDSSFGTNQFVNVDWANNSDSATATEIQPDGKILVAGHSNRVFSLMRLLGDSPIPAFADINAQLVNSQSRGVANGKILLRNLQNNETKIVSTNPFGYFRLNQLPTNNAYEIITTSKRFQFSKQSFRLIGNINGLVVTSN